MKIIALGVICLIITGCAMPNEPTKNETDDISGKIGYFKDSRTNLCFASILTTTYGGSQVASITTVPCDAVSKLLK